MKATVSTKLFLKQLPKDIKKNFAIDMKREIADVIAAKIISGKSPVAGHGEFEEYSDSYEKKKGRKAPVDILVTGKMLDSLTVKQNTKGDLIIFFKSKIAKYHSDKRSARKLRRLLPTTRETFEKGIWRKILSILKKAVKIGVAKQNR